MSKVIDATLRFVDKFTAPMSKAVKAMERSSKQAQRMGKDIQSAGKSISNVGSSLTTGLTLPIAAAGVACFEMASDMQESVNKVDVAFGKNSIGVKKWSDTTLEKYGIAKGTALDMAATYGDMATAMGLTTQKASGMSQKMVGLAGDLSSFKNISIDIANTALTGIFTGETESLKQLGIVMTQANLTEYARSQGIKKSIKDMSQQEQVQLRYNYVLAKTKNAQGDFARTSGGAANQQRIFKESLKESAAMLGTKLLPIGTKLITWVNSLVKKFSGLSDGQQNLIIKIAGITAAIGPCLLIFGKLTSGVGRTIAFVGRLGGAISKAGGIMALITSPAGIVIAVIAAIAVAAFLIIKNWTKVKAFFSKFGSFIKGIFKKSGVDTEKFGNTFKKIKTSIGKSINDLKVIFGKVITFMKPILKFVGGVFIAYWKVYFSALIGTLSGLINGIQQWVSGVVQVFGGIIKFVKGVFTGNWKQAWEGVKEIFGGVFTSLSALVKTPLNMVIGLINGAIAGINKLGLTIPDWVPLLGGKSFSINIPTIPMLAKGTKNWGGGLAVTQEKGGEIMDLPRGTRVYPHDKSIEMARKEGARGGKGSIEISIAKLADKIEVRSDGDIDRIVNRLADELWKRANNQGEVSIA